MDIFDARSGWTAQALPLPHQLFLLSYRASKGRLDDDSAAVRGTLLRAAAVAELRLAGLLHDRGGRAERTNATVLAPLDPFLAAVLDDVPPGRSRSWPDVVDDRNHSAETAVRDQLVATGIITVDHRRFVGLFESHRVGVADPGPIQTLRVRIRDAVLAGTAPVPLGVALLAVLAIDGNVSTVFGWRELWVHRSEARELADRIDRELPGLRPATTASMAARRTPS